MKLWPWHRPAIVKNLFNEFLNKTCYKFKRFLRKRFKINFYVKVSCKMILKISSNFNFCKTEICFRFWRSFKQSKQIPSCFCSYHSILLSTQLCTDVLDYYCTSSSDPRMLLDIWNLLLIDRKKLFLVSFMRRRRK